MKDLHLPWAGTAARRFLPGRARFALAALLCFALASCSRNGPESAGGKQDAGKGDVGREEAPAAAGDEPSGEARSWSGALLETVRSADRLRVRTGSPFEQEPSRVTLFEIADPAGIREFVGRLQVAGCSKACECLGDRCLEFWRGSVLLETASVHHGRALRRRSGGPDAELSPEGRSALDALFEERFDEMLGLVLKEGLGEEQVAGVAAALLEHVHSADGRLLPRLKGGSPRVRGVAAWALAPSPREDVLSALCEALAADPDEGVRRVVADVLGRKGGEKAMRALLGALASDPNVEVRRAAASALGQARDEKAVPGLVEALGRESSEEVRDRIVSSLTIITEQEFGDDPGPWRTWLVSRKGK